MGDKFRSLVELPSLWTSRSISLIVGKCGQYRQKCSTLRCHIYGVRRFLWIFESFAPMYGTNAVSAYAVRVIDWAADDADCISVIGES